MNGQSYGGRLIKGAFLMVLMRWSMRLMGLVSVTILARLLTPEDFGVAGMATVAVALLKVLMDLGVDLAVIRHPNPSRSYYDTAWTFQLLTGLLVGGLMFLTAGLVAAYFREPRLVPVMQVLSAAPVLSGLSNIGIANFRRDLSFGRDLAFNLSTKLASVVVAISVAVILESYWALIAGLLANSASHCIASYVFHKYRPRLSLKDAAELFSFSVWVFVRGLATFGNGNLHRLIGGRLSGATGFGAYSVSFQLSKVLVGELIQPVGRALVPGYAKLQHDEARLAAGFRKVAGITAALSFAMGGGLASVAPEAVAILLGDKWQESVLFLQIFAIASAFSWAAQPAGPLLTAINRVRRAAALTLARLALLAPVLAWAASTGELVNVAYAHAATAMAFAPAGLFVSTLGLGVGLRLLADFARSMLAAAAMAGAIYLIPLTPADGVVVSAMVKIIAGGLVFASAQFVLWRISGRPDSFEGDLIARMRVKLEKGLRNRRPSPGSGRA